MRRTLLPLTLATMALMLPASAAVDPTYHAEQSTIADISQIGEDAEHEVWIQAGTATQYASNLDQGPEPIEAPLPEPQELSGACISISRVVSRYDEDVPGSSSLVWIDEVCTEDLAIDAAAGLAAMTIEGTVDSTLYRHTFDGQNFELDEVGPSTIEVDLIVVGDGPYGPAFSEQLLSAFFCGLPWDGDFRGGGAITEPGYGRDALVTGTLTSSSADVGPVDTSTLRASLAEFLSLWAGACVSAV